MECKKVDKEHKLAVKDSGRHLPGSFIYTVTSWNRHCSPKGWYYFIHLRHKEENVWREVQRPLQGRSVSKQQRKDLHPHQPFWLRGGEFAYQAGESGLTPGSGRSPGEGNGNPLQYSCLGNPMDRGAWWATVHGVTKQLDTTEWLNNTNNQSVCLRLRGFPGCGDFQY